MPRIVRETKVIHADWWSDARDEQGQFKERCIIRRLSYGQRQELTAAWIDVSGDVGTPSLKISSDVVQRMNLAILEVGIVSMTDPEGEEIEVTPQAVFELSERDGEFTLAEIQALNPTLRRTAEEEVSFPGGRGDSAEDGEQATG